MERLRKKATELKAGIVILASCILLGCFSGCVKKSDAHTAFYSWKTALELNPQESALLKNAANNHLYLRFFDVSWDAQQKEVIPNAVINIKQDVTGLSIIPVVYITNKSFEHTSPAQADSLAVKVNNLVSSIARQHQISYENVQIDCDWTVGTRASYFAFLKAFKNHSGKQLEATIRLHQIKYPDRTGVPPVDKGLLMFYNMGKFSADLKAPNSIYNAEDAEKYLGTLPRYTLPLDIALPVFSWAIHIRDNKVIQLYSKIGKTQLSDQNYFENQGGKNGYRAIKSFYLEGIYFKTGDLFKLEEINLKELDQAAKQVSAKLAPMANRNIIYYELSTTNLSTINEKDLKEVSARF